MPLKKKRKERKKENTDAVFVKKFVKQTVTVELHFCFITG
jgi:hypothetical protein